MARLKWKVAVLICLTAATASPAGAEIRTETQIEDKACPICEAKRRFHELAPWLELGADVRLRLYYQQNQKLSKRDHATREWLWQRHRARVWACSRTPT